MSRTDLRPGVGLGPPPPVVQDFRELTDEEMPALRLFSASLPSELRQAKAPSANGGHIFRTQLPTPFSLGSGPHAG
jgi:hypothetical protein